jgi:hypothetical protein
MGGFAVDLLPEVALLFHKQAARLEFLPGVDQKTRVKAVFGGQFMP